MDTQKCPRRNEDANKDVQPRSSFLFKVLFCILFNATTRDEWPDECRCPRRGRRVAVDTAAQEWRNTQRLAVYAAVQPMLRHGLPADAAAHRSWTSSTRYARVLMHAHVRGDQWRPTSAGKHGGVLQCRYTRRPPHAHTSTTEPHTIPRNSEPLQGRRQQTAAKHSEDHESFTAEIAGRVPPAADTIRGVQRLT